MSPRAAWRLETLGFSEVYDYVPGKMDWLAYDLPYEGEAILAAVAIDRDAPTCRLGERMSEVRDRFPNLNEPCVALNDADVVVGVVQPDDLAAADALVEDVLHFGVTTVRPSEDLPALIKRMRDANVDSILVTRSDATLVGILHRDTAERTLDDRSQR